MMISGMTVERFVEGPIVGNRHSCLSALTIRKPVRVTNYLGGSQAGSSALADCAHGREYHV